MKTYTPILLAAAMIFFASCASSGADEPTVIPPSATGSSGSSLQANPWTAEGQLGSSPGGFALPDGEAAKTFAAFFAER